MDSSIEHIKTPIIRTCVNHIEICSIYGSKDKMFIYLDTILMFKMMVSQWLEF
jgi:uncharacterized membrane protein